MVNIAFNKETFSRLWNKLKNVNPCKILFYIDQKIVINSDEDLKKIIQSFHDSNTGIHRGINKTFEMINKDYRVKKLYRKVKSYVNSCLVCQKVKIRKKTKQPMGLRKIPEYPFHTISWDFFGPLVSTDSEPSYSNILTIACEFSRFLILVPTVDQTATTVAKALLDNVIYPYGTIPEVILSDNGSSFKSKVLKQVMKMLKIKCNYADCYSPWINGLCEKKNLQIKYYLQTSFLETGRKNNWHKSLNSLAYNYNSTINSSTGFPPFTLVFGDHVQKRNLSDLSIPKFPYVKSYSDYIISLHESIKFLQTQAKRNLIEAQNKSKIYYDKKSNPIVLKERDLVLKLNPNANKLGKFEAKYTGPYEVISISGSSATIKEGNKMSKVNLNLLRKYLSTD